MAGADRGSRANARHDKIVERQLRGIFEQREYPKLQLQPDQPDDTAGERTELEGDVVAEAGWAGRSEPDSVEEPKARPPGERLATIRSQRIAAGKWPLSVGDGKPKLSEPLVPSDGGPPCSRCGGARFLRNAVEDIRDPAFGTVVSCNVPACRAWQNKTRNAELLRRLPREWSTWTLKSFANRIRNDYPEAWSSYKATIAELNQWLNTDFWLYMFSTGVDGTAGGSGRGKTGMAFGLLRELMDRGMSGEFRVVNDMLDEIRTRYRNSEVFSESGEAEIQGMMNVDVLVLDDIGAERITGTGWVQDVLFRIIGHRHMHHKRTIFTSNQNLAEIAEHYDHPRTPSRIKERCDRGNWVLDMSALPDIREAGRRAMPEV
jgi:hypothetical protein